MLIALIMIVLLGAVGVIIDGGGLLVLQRDAQNAADAASFEAASAKCNNQSDWITRGEDAAASNGFATGDPNHTVNVQQLDPADLPAGAFGLADQYVVVEITANADPYFIQILYDGPLAVTVRAVSHCRSGDSQANIPAIMGLGTCPGAGGNEQCGSQQVLDFSLNKAYITGGVHSNCNCDFNTSNDECTPADLPLDYDPAKSPVCNALLDGVTCVGTAMHSEKWYADPPEESGADPMPDLLADIYKYEYYQPGGWYANLALVDTCAAHNIPGEDAGQSGGCYHYYTSDLNRNDAGDVFEGIYFVEGSISEIKDLDVGPQGATFIARTGTIAFKKMPYDAASVIRPYEQGGFLLAFTQSSVCSGQGAIDLGGSNDNAFHGVVYGPYGECNLALADSINFWGAWVCNTVDVSSATFVLHFSPDLLPPQPSHVTPSE